MVYRLTFIFLRSTFYPPGTGNASTLVRFRKRITPELLQLVNETVIEEARKEKNPPKGPPSGGGASGEKEATEETGENAGTRILDATCVPSEIRYPTDVDLLHRSREYSEALIDELHAQRPGQEKPRTYRKVARKEYLFFARNRKPSYKLIRRALRKQPGYLRRNLGHIEALPAEGLTLSPGSPEKLSVINTVYRQQLFLYESRSHRVEDRIVSLHMPWVRPIVRGKTQGNVEFGAKVAISLVEGYARVEKLSWDAFNESRTLRESVERYKRIHGVYPKRILGDKIYRTRENLRYCKEHGITMSGPKLDVHFPTLCLPGSKFRKSGHRQESEMP